jgi:hypothetical protein
MTPSRTATHSFIAIQIRVKLHLDLSEIHLGSLGIHLDPSRICLDLSSIHLGPSGIHLDPSMTCLGQLDLYI